MKKAITIIFSILLVGALAAGIVFLCRRNVDDGETGCTHEEFTILDGYPATCTATGLTLGTVCSDCGEVLIPQRILPKLEHKEIPIPAVPADCMHEGKTEGKKCAVCGEILQYQNTVPKTEHVPMTVPAVPATCTQTGLTEGSVCEVCGEVLKAQDTVEIDSTAHILFPICAVAPTCTSDGWTAGVYCSLCGYAEQERTLVPMTDHSYTKWQEESAEPCSSISDGYCRKSVQERHCTECHTEEHKEVKIFNHEIDRDGTCHGCGSVFVEYEVTGGTLTKVKTHAFVSDLYIPDTVRTVSSGAFFGARFDTVYVPSTVTSVESGAFSSCYGEDICVFISNGCDTLRWASDWDTDDMGGTVWIFHWTEDGKFPAQNKSEIQSDSEQEGDDQDVGVYAL